jgi:hypothetical protein
MARRTRKQEQLRTAEEETPEEETTEEEETEQESSLPSDEDAEVGPYNPDIPGTALSDQFEYVKVSDKHFFTGSGRKFRSDGTYVMFTDFVESDKGESYPGMPATAAQLKVDGLNEDGEPAQTGGVLDNPTTMQQWHVLQRFPVGTRTAIKRGTSGGRNEWIVWRYATQSMVYKGKVTKGYLFVQEARYDDAPPVRGRGGDVPSPPKDVVDLANRGGYWYNGKKYP